ncbi:MAG: transporter [Zunongwangia sp.]|nr:transporter [Zunongwangia sp.]
MRLKMEFLNNSYLILFLIICLGFMLGNLKVKGISLDISAIIFVALIFGHLGATLPDILEKIGLILFIYTIGLQAGPGFFEAFKDQGKNLIVIAVVVVLSATFLTYIAILIFDIDKPIAIGLLSGALTSTPGLAAGIDVTKSNLVSIGYGIAYPLGVILVIIFVRLYPQLFKLNIDDLEKEYKQKMTAHQKPIFTRNFIVENNSAIGMSIEQLGVREMTKGIISRVKHNDHVFTPTPQTVLHKNDLLKAVGTEDALKRIGLLIGSTTDEELYFNEEYVVQSFLITKPQVINKNLTQLNLRAKYDATITRLRRSGIELSASPRTKLQMGDKITLVCAKNHIQNISEILGDDNTNLSDTDFFPIATGIVLGILIGQISLNFGASFQFSLGLTGGILIVAMLLGRLGKTGPVLWSMSGTANNLLRQLGLMLFLASVGTKAGATFVETFNQYGINLFIVGAVVTFFPMLLATIVARIFLKLNILSMLGTLTGAMTSTPGLAATDSLTKSNAPAVAYATVYPIAMVLLILCIQLLGRL